MNYLPSLSIAGDDFFWIECTVRFAPLSVIRWTGGALDSPVHSSHSSHSSHLTPVT